MQVHPPNQVGRLYSSGPTPRVVIETVGYSVLVTMLTASALAYLIVRLGFLQRAASHRPVPRAVIDDHFGAHQPSITVLVPSYREQPRVIRQTLLSAALQEFPGLRIALLIDDPPNPTSADDQRLLESALKAPADIVALLKEPHERAVAALAEFDQHHGPSRSSQLRCHLLGRRERHHQKDGPR